ncbi:MAG: adenylate/guanylate cyclase domain-containing protein [Alphaproteobacteria bacterium]|nr:adenylate/guanylate cyclase domain-containing protein [Alphaproteobacteria bacterium]
MTSSHMFRGPFQWLSALPLLAVTGILTVMAIMTLTSAQSPEARSREVLFDYFQRMAPAEYDASEKFHLVLIDRESVEAVGPWPWPRTVLASLVDATAEAGARGVILTEPVDKPDPLSPETIGRFWLEGASDDALAEQLSRLPRTDVVLARAFSKTKGAVAVSLTPPGNPNQPSAMQRADAKDAGWLNITDSGADYIALPGARYLYGLNPELSRAAQPAVAALATDPDGVFRRAPLLWSLDGKPAPSIALKAAQLALGDNAITAKVNLNAANPQGRVLKAISLSGGAFAISPQSAVRLYLPKRLNIPTTSAARLLAGAGSNSQLSGAVVLIGLDGDLGETIRTPRGEMPLVELHALAAAQITAAAMPKRPGWTGYLEALGVMVFGAAAIMIAQRMQFWQAVGFAAAVSVVLVLAAYSAFSLGGLLVNPLAPSLALFVGALSVAGGKSIGGVLRDDSVRGSFHDTLPEPAMKKLREESGGDILEGVNRDITVLACELRFPDEDLHGMENIPGEVTKLMAAASLDLRQTIIDTGGVADQAEGGRIFAYYNTPTELADHVQAGCAAALRMIESMDKINTDLEASSVTRGMQLHLAIGVATGPCFAGPMGHGRNNRYSAMGPAVDRAAFLRNQSEYYGPAMICDEPVYKQTHHLFAYLELDKIRTRNAERPFCIFALIGNPFIKSSKGFRDLDEAHREMLIAYRAGKAERARELLDKTKKSPGAKIALFDIYEERVRKLSEQGAPEDWDGVHEAGA